MLIKEFAEFVDKVRSFFKKRGYTEVFTPVLQPFPNLDPHIEPIELKVKKPKETTVYLQTSPEHAMKKLLSKYKIDIFQIAKVFRNGEHGKWHRVEFSMLEWYKVGATFEDLMEEIGELLSYLGISDSYTKIRLEHAFEEYAGIILSEDEEIFKNNLIAYGYDFDDKEDWETLFYRIYIDVERFLGQDVPTFITHFPSRLCMYAKVVDGYAERFELYIKGVEIANGWTEETSKEEILKRMEAFAKAKGLNVDQELIRAYDDFPPCAGCSIGLERLFMVWKGIDGFDNLETLFA